MRLDLALDTLIVATEPHIIHQMEKAAPQKTFIGAPGADGNCNCNMCPYMALNTMEKLYVSLRDLEPRIEIEESLRLAREEVARPDAGDGRQHRRQGRRRPAANLAATDGIERASLAAAGSIPDIATGGFRQLCLVAVGLGVAAGPQIMAVEIGDQRLGLLAAGDTQQGVDLGLDPVVILLGGG